MKCDQISELLAGLSLGCLDKEDEAAVLDHIALCEGCHEQFDACKRVVDRLAFAAPPAAPSERLKPELMRRINKATDSSLMSSRKRREPSSLLAWLRPGPAWVFASIVMICALSASNLLLWQRSSLKNVQQPVSLNMVTMEGTPAAPIADGTLVYLPGQPQGVLVVSDLPFLDKQQQYQLWLVHDGKRTSGGVFSVSQTGYARLIVKADRPIDSYPVFGITIEPAGGSLGPTGSKVLGSS
jgi:anti-sigma-K factor RskA